MLDFTDHMVLITGAGIGSGVAKAFHDAGARVALGDFCDKALARTAASLGGSSGVYTRPVDVRDARSTAEFFNGAERALGPVTVAVANAGIYPNIPVLEMSRGVGSRDGDQRARGLPHLPGRHALHGGWRQARQDHHPLVGRLPERADPEPNIGSPLTTFRTI